jgi:TolA-binding protein
LCRCAWSRFVPRKLNAARHAAEHCISKARVGQFVNHFDRQQSSPRERAFCRSSNATATANPISSRMKTLGTCAIALACLLCVASLAAPARADAGDDQYAVGAEHYSQQRWKLAAEEFASLIEKYPDHSRRDSAEFFLGETQMQLGDFAAAIKHFETYIGRAPTGRYARQAMFRAGESAFLAGNAADAKPRLEAFVAKHGDDDLAGYAIPYLARLALEAKRVDEAAQLYQRAIDKFPNGPLADDSRFSLARIDEQQGRLVDAERRFREIAERKGSAIADVAQFRVGLVQYTRKDFAAAEKTFAALPAAFPKSTLQTKALYWSALSIKAQERWQQAAALLVDLAGKDAKNALADAMRFHAGDALLAANKPTEALEQFDALLKDYPSSPLAGDALVGKLKAAKAIDPKHLDATFQQIAQNEHGKTGRRAASALRIYGQSLLDAGRYDEALARLEEAQAALDAPSGKGNDQAEQAADRNDLAAQRITIAYLIAIARHGAGQYEKALADFDKLLAPPVEATIPSALRSSILLGRASTLVRLERYEPALAVLEDFLAHYANTPELGACLSELALCHAGMKQFGDAQRYYNRFGKEHRTDPNFLPTTHRLAEMAYRAGERTWAAELFGLLAAEGNPPEYVARGLSGQAWCEFSSQNLAASAATFMQLVDKFPTDPLAAEGALVRGKALERLEQFDPALLMYQLVIDQYPKSPETPSALLAAGALHERLKQSSDARDCYRQFLNRFPHDAKADVAAYQLAWLLIETPTSDTPANHRDQANPDHATQPAAAADKLAAAKESEALFERIHAEHKQSRYWADAVYRLAEAARGRKDAARIGQLCDELVAAKAPEETVAHAFYLLGRLAADEQHWPDAAAAMAKLTQHCPKSSLCLAAEYWIAEAAYRQSKFDQASEKFAALTQRAKSSGASWAAMAPLRLAQVLAQKKEWPDAITLAESIAKDYPDFVQQYEVDYVLGRCYAAQARFDDARKAYERVVRSAQGGKTETAAMAQWMIGETYFHQNEYELAVREYLRVEILYAFPQWQSSALIQAGKAYESAGNYPEALKLYSQVLQKYAKTDHAEEAAKRLRVVQERVSRAERSNTDRSKQ